MASAGALVHKALPSSCSKPARLASLEASSLPQRLPAPLRVPAPAPGAPEISAALGSTKHFSPAPPQRLTAISHVPSPEPSLGPGTLTLPGSVSLRRAGVRVAAAEGKLGFLSRLGRVIKEKAESDFNRVFKGVSKTRESLRVVDELLTYWNLNEADSILEELEEALIVADFGPRTALRIVDGIRKDVEGGVLQTGEDIRAALKASIVSLLKSCKASTQLQLTTSKPAVIMVVGVNGGGKTTTIGKLSHRFKKDGAKVMLAAGDTFRAAAREQLSVWAERTGAQFYAEAGDKARPATVLANAARKASEDGIDIVFADTSGRLHTNFNLMEELKACKRALSKTLPSAPTEVLMVLDGTTGLNMLPQAKEFNQAVGVTGFVLTKLDGTARGGCVASVVDTLGIPVKFVGVGEGLEDLQPFDADTFVDALFPSR